MSSRSFRDRYQPLDSRRDMPVEDHSHDSGWPLPDGGALFETSFGHTVMCDAVFGGDDIQLARSMLNDAGIAGDVSSTIFVDTETTGLAGGTGTHVFLVGLGRFEHGSFRVRQYFLRHPGEERALLDAIEQDVRDASCLVSYNGRTFDIPMLETRFRMHHHHCRFPDMHLDLLHPVRSVWKHRLPSCSLGTVEQYVLGVTRVDDAPGWMIPQLYFSYLQSRRIETLRDVFNHNRQDIVSLARIAGLVHSYQAGLSIPDHPSDRLGVAIIQIRLGDIDRALPVIRQDSGSALAPAELRYRAVREASVALKRARRYPEAIDLWHERLADPSRAIRMLAAEELAKYMEHHSRDHRAALDVAMRAVQGAQLAGDRIMIESFTKRIERLESKLARVPLPVSDTDELENV